MRVNRLNALQKCNARDLSTVESLSDVRVVTVFKGNFGKLEWQEGQFRTVGAIHLFLPPSFTDIQVDRYVSIYDVVGKFYD